MRFPSTHVPIKHKTGLWSPKTAERAVYLRTLPDTLKAYILSAPNLKERRQRIVAAVAILRQHPLEVAVKAAEQALEQGKTDINSLRIFAALQAGSLTVSGIIKWRDWGDRPRGQQNDVPEL